MALNQNFVTQQKTKEKFGHGIGNPDQKAVDTKGNQTRVTNIQNRGETRCFKCSRFNNRHRECIGEESCTLCTGAHKLKDCTEDPRSYKCINYLSYNNYHPNKYKCSNHSSLDKKCPSLLAILEKYRQYTD